ncbi:MltR family transcriptional regulator [Salinimicrobium sediminilitoris]|uniref:MltR family transcriptional regulator n=1 Tax=Salinimicrobium sediminilitoris TaxID=2876715 RepID=UPI001E3B2031|nr:MltR family transcriptional regulator [Salinimicrobium sediminilitoris]MCC8358918.1 MltR family transcriptional regulator [Salinimicrobium sediminilitoris]
MLTDKELNKIKDVQKLRKFLEVESDRGCCLLAVSFLDNEIKLLLENKLVGTEKFKNNLFSLNGPLGTFSSKIDLSFSIGLIGDDVKGDIHIIRKIRNEFGHSYDPIDFNSQKIKSRIENLKHNIYKSDEKIIREQFIDAVTLILAEISDTDYSHSKFSQKGNKRYLDNPKLANFLKKGIDKIYNE